MQTQLAKKLGLDFPIFAFTHCRDVVAAVSNSGGIGVLGATGFSPDQLEIELDWIDDKVGNKPYGVDVIIPKRFEGRGERDIEKQRAMVKAAIPEGYTEYARQLLDDGGVPPLPPGKTLEDRLSMTDAVSAPLVDVALRHKNCRLIANQK
jgi:NAD(P)H-dependent flavin oxidoreductase YrpB (nitropropane dioxygenase family)